MINLKQVEPILFRTKPFLDTSILCWISIQFLKECFIFLCPKGCNLDISIDGYDIGGWVVDGGKELTIERPAYEAKRLTFYRVKTAPKKAGIEPGRSENGVVKCVFTPEAFEDVTVIIPGYPEPLKVNIAPSANVGELKHEVQTQLNVSPDLDQILVLNDKVVSNYTRLR